MDKQQAKFLLSSFRPDGADASSPEFAQALQLAAEDRELGEWLAQERATDAAFAEALSSVPIPNGLRDEILAVLEYDGRAQEGDAEVDSIFTGGMASIQPPAGLRDQIIAAMELQTESSEMTAAEKVTDIAAWRWLSVAAAAAAVVVGIYVSTNSLGDPEPALVNNLNELAVPDQPVDTQVRTVAVHNAVQQMAAKLTSPEGVDLNKDLGCAHDAMQFLDTKSHPVPEVLPPGLGDAKLVGARDMYLENGQPVSLLCFEKEGMGMVHLIVLDTANVKDADKLNTMKSISLKNCYGCSRTKFNIAHWSEGDKAYMILTKANKQEMVKLF
ncbi:hypothetical protein [Rubritalea tangerina]|uniref:Uncharacterized protein n=1 Tax=Rubritalea tangerina TaxID=430798 RepID=A0ABW4ZBU4_9BACT